MFGNEADRVARERARQQKRNEDQARDAKRQEIVARLNALVQEIETETSIVLRIEAKRDYPGIVKVQVPGLLGLKSTKGGWEIGGYETTDANTDSDIHTTIYLLSNGRIGESSRLGTHVKSPKDMADQEIDFLSRHVDDYDTYSYHRRPEDILRLTLEGPRRLRSELEAG